MSNVAEIDEFCKKNFDRYELIVVDDGSSDNTYNMLKDYEKSLKIKLLRNPVNLGKGAAVKAGIMNAELPLVLFSDIDLATPLEELNKFVKYLPEYDIIIGSRNHPESVMEVNQSRFRQFLGKCFPILVNIFIMKDIRDTQCGFKLFKTKVAKEVFSFQTIKGFAFDVEILLIAKKLSYKIKEMPVVWKDKKGSKISPLKDAVKMLLQLFAIKYNSFNKKYTKRERH